MYWLLFPLAVIEGPITTVVAGAGVSLGYLFWWPAFIILVVGDVVGDLGHYYIGKWGGRAFIVRWGKYLGLKESHVVSVEEVLADHPGKSILLSKLAHGAGGAVLVAAGMVKMPLKKFIFWNTVGTLPKTFGLLLIGFYFANAITRINSIMDVVASVTIILSIIIIFAWIYVYRKKSERELK